MPDPEWTGLIEDGPRTCKRIVMTIGSHHLQVYWYPTGEARELSRIPVV